MTILVVCGLAAEARIAAGPGVVTVAAPPASLPAALARVDADLAAVVSFGIAGGLAPGFVSGTLCVAGGQRGGGAGAGSAATGGVARASAAAEAIAARCARGGIRAFAAALVSTLEPVATPAAKLALHRATSAAAVDTESAIAFAFAAARGLPFLALRAVADDAESRLPPLALVAVAPDGRLAPRAILRELLARPGQLVALPGTARATARALATLRRARALLGPTFGIEDITRQQR